MKAWLLHWGPALVWGLVILILSGDWGSSAHTLSLFHRLLSLFISLSPQELEALHHVLRKVGHVTAYGLLYLLFHRALKLHCPARPWCRCLVALVLSLSIALLDEGRQSLLYSRSGSLADVCLDLSGATAAALLTFGRWRPQGPRPRSGSSSPVKP